jgi:uncharacterized protein (UPF0248 family)
MASTEGPRSLQTFLDGFIHFVRIDFSCKQVDEEHPHEIAQELLQGLQTLCRTIATSKNDAKNEIHSQLWPTILTTCEADAVISTEAHQDRGTFLIGLHGEIDNEDMIRVLRAWQIDMWSTTLFIDYIPVPALAVLLIRREDLGQIMVDSWTNPELMQQPINIFTPTATYQECIDAAKPSTTAKRAGNAVAAAITDHSRSPGKKLTPASAILNRLKWDGAFKSKDYIVVYEDRHAGLMERPVDAWDTESTEETFIPLHRVRSVKKKSTGMVVWHREERIDLISGS